MVERLTPLWTFQEFIPEDDGEFVRFSDYAELQRRFAEAREALDACEAYFDNRSDVSDGDYGIPEPNEEMRLLDTVRAAKAGSRV